MTTPKSKRPRRKKSGSERGSLSAEQSAAVRADGADVCVLAGAGSGKTRVLVERYLYCVLERGTPADRVLAITFTDKAANEMKERLVAAFAQRGTPAQQRQLERGTIGTFHSLCLKILREHPIEAGVDPQFRVLGEGEADVLRGRAMDAVFGARADDERWTDLLALQGEDPIRRSLLSIHAAMRASDRPGDYLRPGGSAAEAETQRMRLTALLERIPPTPSKTAGINEKKLIELGPRLKALVADPALPDEVRIAEIEDIELPQAKGPYADLVVTLREQIVVWAESVRDVLGAEDKKLVAEVMRAFVDAYEAAKREIAALDFDDLLIFVERLLSGPTPMAERVARIVRESYDQVLVDEYQDTNALQEKLVESLRRPGCLYAVGDDQQAIYGFRHTDPEIFRRYAARPGVLRRELRDNYRSQEAVLRTIARLLEGLCGPGSFRPQKALAPPMPCASPRITVCLTRQHSEEKLDADALRILEARQAVARIAAWVGDPQHPTRYSDIAILSRSTTHYPYYENELIAAGIPYFAVRGRGFYDKPEVKDLIAWLRHLEDPASDVPLAALLRGPAVGLSDDGLLLLATSPHRGPDEGKDAAPLWQALENGATALLDPEDALRAESFRRLSVETRARKDALRIHEILERFIDATDLEVKHLLTAGGAQKAANIRKFVEIARSTASGGVGRISDLLRYLEALSDREAEESQARVQSERGDAVLLSSVHAVKGLEFRCVILVDLGAKGTVSRGGPFAASADRGLGLRITDPLDPDRKRQDRTYSRVSEDLRSQENRESERLLYVALTRARDRLVLSGSVKPTKSGVSEKSPWMYRMTHALGIDPIGQQDSVDVAGTPVAVLYGSEPPVSGRVSAPALARRPALAARWSQGQEALEAAAAAEGLPYDAQGADRLLERLTVPSKPYEHTLDVTVTALAAAAADGYTPSERLDFVDAEPDKGPEGDEAGSTADDGQGRTPADEYGTVYHALMEWWLRMRPRRNPEPEEVAHLLAPLRADEKERLLVEASDFWSGSWGQRVLASKRAYAELPFLYKARRGLLKGQMDLVYLDSRAGWTVLDYKTNQTTTAADIERLVEAYRTQIGLYALVFAELSGQSPSAGVLYFSRARAARVIGYRPASYEDLKIRLEEVYERMVVSSAAGTGRRVQRSE